jgi:putative N6-adenine-specific DNA methylase
MDGFIPFHREKRMNLFELIATTTFGIEAVCKRELIDLGFEVTRTENGKVTFLSDEAGIARANLWLRSSDRVLLKIDEFKAETFDELFNQTSAIDWATGFRWTENSPSTENRLSPDFSVSRTVKRL